MKLEIAAGMGRLFRINAEMSRPSPTADCAVLVASCDAYSDLWTPFFTLLKRYWPDQPFPLYLGAGHLPFSYPGLTVLRSDAGRDWSLCVSDYLDQISTPYVLMLLDDFFLRRIVRNDEIFACLAFARAHEATQVRLIPRPKPTDQLDGNNLIGKSAVGSPYRLSTQAAIWDRLKLRTLLRAGESIWEFEHKGNIRTNNQATGFYAAWRPVLPYEGFFAHHVVEKGKWFPHEKWIFGRRKIGCDFTRRKTLGLSQVIFYHLAQVLDHFLDVFRWQTKARLKRKLKSVLQPIFRKRMAQLGSRPHP